jgi:succinate dehydrogenase flavin-adding protein (antitoxin of CptAB toxin-antitoxin module)
MSRSLNQIVESILKLSNIFYSLSDATYKAAASPTLEAKQIKEDLSQEELLRIKEYNELLPSVFENIKRTIRLAILSLNANEEYLSELKGSVDGQDCVVKLDCLIKICDEVIKNKVGVFDYVQYVNDINKYIEDEFKELQKFDFIKYIISPLIDKIKFVYGLDVINSRSKKQFEQLILAGGRYKKDEKFSKQLLEKEESVDDIDVLLKNYPKEELSEIDKGILELQLNPINEIAQEFENLEKNINEGGGEGRATELKSLRQKTNIQLETAEARLKSAEKRLGKLKEEIPQNKKNIEEEESIIELYKSSVTALKGKLKWGDALDQLEKDLGAAGGTEKEVEKIKAEALQKFNDAFKVHRASLLEANQKYYTSLGKAESLGKLSDDNYSWAEEITQDVSLITKLKDCQDFFIRCRTNPYLYGGVKASQFKSQFPFLVSNIKSKKIKKDDLEEQILDLFKLKEAALKFSEENSDFKKIKTNESYLAEKTLERVKQLLVKQHEGTLVGKEGTELEEKINKLEGFDPNLLQATIRKQKEDFFEARKNPNTMEAFVAKFVAESGNDFLLFKKEIKIFINNIEAAYSQFGEKAIGKFKNLRPEELKKLIDILKEEDPNFLNAVKSEIFINMFLAENILTRTELLKVKDPDIQIKEFIKSKNFDEFIPQINRAATGTISSLANHIEKIKPQFAEAGVALEKFQKSKYIAEVIKKIRDIVNKSSIESLSSNQEFTDSMNTFISIDLKDQSELKKKQEKIKNLYEKIFINKEEAVKEELLDPSKFPESALVDIIRQANNQEFDLEIFKDDLNDPDSEVVKWVTDSKDYDSWHYPEKINNIVNYFNSELSKLGITYK